MTDINFLNFPHDIQEYIYNHLNVIDKCIFNRVAKFNYIKRHSIETQKTFGILYKLITNKKITTLTFAQTRYLSVYDKSYPSDPSIQEIALIFPEIREKPQETLYEKIKAGTVTADCLKNINLEDLYKYKDLYEVIASVNSNIFKILYKIEIMKIYIDSWRTTIYYFTIYACNEDLFLYIKNNRILDVDYDYKKTSIDLDYLSNNKIRAFMLKHFTYSREEIETIKQECIDHLHIDAYLDFSKI